MLVLLLTSATDRDGSAQADDKSELHGNIWLRAGAVPKTGCGTSACLRRMPPLPLDTSV